jgi:hypothetical protein
MAKSPFEQIADYEAKIEELKEAAVADLRAKANALEQELGGIYQEIERITGKGPRKRKALGGIISGGGKKADIADAKELKKILSGAEGKRLNRKALIDIGYNLKSALAIARGDEKTFGFKQNAAQGEVWLK